jgi:hypothetical protein
MKLRLFIMALVYAAAQSAAAYTPAPGAGAPDWQADWSYNLERPSWQAPNASDYENFTVMVVKIEEALQPYATKDDLLALFVGDELRGLYVEHAPVVRQRHVHVRAEAVKRLH